MSAYPMVDEVNRLVGDLLAGSGEVSLPGVGTLYVERRGAKRLSRRSILPPSRVVSFTSQLRGEALPAVIAAKVPCSIAEAEEVYERWLARVREGDTLTIGGVGVLKFKSFTLFPAFDRLLNPQGHEPVRIRPVRRFDWALWVGIVAIVIAAGFGGNEFLKLYAGDEPAVAADETPAAETAVETAAPADSLAPAQPGGTADNLAPADSEPGGTAVAVGAEASATTAAAETSVPATVPELQTEAAAAERSSAPAGTAGAPALLIPGHHYAVLGVFSTPENAARAAADAEAKEASVRCGIYRFGSKYMVSPFEAADAEACALFIRNHGDRFPGLWPYTAR